MKFIERLILHLIIYNSRSLESSSDQGAKLLNLNVTVYVFSNYIQHEWLGIPDWWWLAHLGIPKVYILCFGDTKMVLSQFKASIQGFWKPIINSCLPKLNNQDVLCSVSHQRLRVTMDNIHHTLKKTNNKN